MSLIATQFYEHVRSRDAPGILFAIILVFFAVIAFNNVPELPRQIDDLPALRDAEEMHENPAIFYSGFHHRTGRPTGHIARYIIYLFCGTNQKSFYLFSIALHITIAFLVSHIAHKWQAAMPRLSGILFLLNVAHFKAVHHIAALEYLLATAFSMSAYLLLWDKERLLAQSWRIGFFYICVICATASHIASWGMWPIYCAVMWHKKYEWKSILKIAIPLLLMNMAFSIHMLIQVRIEDHTTTSRALDLIESGEVWSASILQMYAWFVAYLFLFAHAAPWPMWENPHWQIGLGGILIFAALWTVYKERSILTNHCILWIACTLIPFAFQSEQTITHVPGPSRYLYLATVSSSILISQGLAFPYRFRGSKVWWNLAVVGLLCSSLFYLRTIEALSWYTGSFIVRSEGNLALANSLMRRAIERGFAVIPREEAYMRLLLVEVEENPGQAFSDASNAIQRLPESQTLQTIHLALQAHLDPVVLAELSTNERRPLAAGILYNLGRGYFLKGDYSLAKKALEASLALDPNKTASMEILGSLLIGSQEMDRGLSLIRKAAAIKGDSTIYHMVLRNLGQSLQ